MKNSKVSLTLSKIADLLEIKGNETYRVRAYRKAAEVIANLPRDIEELDAAGETRSIPGVGESIAKKIHDIVTTGTTPYYEELKSRYPETLLELLYVPGVGPRTAVEAYQKLGVKTVDELEAAAREHRLSRETGVGKKGEETILKGIALFRKDGGRMPVSAAFTVARGFLEALCSSPLVGRASEAGSLRRRQETVGDLDLVAETDDPSGVAAFFAHLPQVESVIESGPSMTAVRTVAGKRIDLRLSPPESYGAMLHHFTGSKLHNIKLRGMAREKGLSISEYGVFRLDTGERVVSGRTEEDVYAELGLPWIPPELREDRGEIEAALEGRLPALVEEREIKGDLHVHTNASDGANTLEEMVEAARLRGYSYIAVCDHSQSLKIAGGLSEAKLRARIDEIRRINGRQRGFTVLAGAEVDILAAGTLDYPQGLLRELDIVVASIHSGFRQDEEKMTGRITSAIETGLVDIFAHPTGRLINRRNPYNVNLERVFKAAAAQGTAMEINCSPDRLDLNDVYSRAAKERGLKIAVNTDAHGTGDYGNVRYGLFMARRGWLEAGDVINTMEAGALQAWLSERRKQRLNKAA